MTTVVPLAPGRARDLLTLTKPRITLFVVLTAAVGCVLAAGRGADVTVLLHLMVGTALVAAGSAALNQLAERDLDGRMRRTARRPLPAGRVSGATAAVLGLGAAVAGTLWLATFVSIVTAGCAAVTLILYVLVYTPLKRRTALAIFVGAVPGALPVVGGWTAGGGGAGAEIWAFFWIVFLWQLPHFLALAWMYRADYARAGLPMLSVGDPDGRRTFSQAALHATALIPVSLLPSLLGVAGWLHFGGAALAGTLYAGTALTAAVERTDARARELFRASLLYLPTLFAFLVADRLL